MHNSPCATVSTFVYPPDLPPPPSARGALDLANKAKGLTQKEIGNFKKNKEEPPEELMAKKKEHEENIIALEKKEADLIELRDNSIGQIGAQRTTARVHRCLRAPSHQASAEWPYCRAAVVTCRQPGARLGPDP